MFTNAKVKDDFVYKFIETLENNKADLIAVQPALREFSAARLYKKYDIPYHPGALKYFKDKQHRGQGGPVTEAIRRRSRHCVSEERIVPGAEEFASTASQATVLLTNVFQALLVAVVVLWVLDVPRQVFDSRSIPSSC